MTARRLKVHITGVNGLVGNVVYRHLSQCAERYDVYGSARRREHSLRLAPDDMATVPEDHFHLADLSDATAMQKAIAGMDVVLHIGAIADENQPWEPILQANIIGTHNVLQACRLAGIKRLVYASSMRVNMGSFITDDRLQHLLTGQISPAQEATPRISHLEPTSPTEDYGASKVWGEAVCHAFALEQQAGVICLRIGAVQIDDQYKDPLLAAGWCSHRDIAHFFEHALLATAQPGYEIAYACSDNQGVPVDLEHSRQVLGYWPQDRAIWPPSA